MTETEVKRNDRNGPLHPAGVFFGTLVDYGLIKMIGPQVYFAVIVSTQIGDIKGLFPVDDKRAVETVAQIRELGFRGDDLGALNADRSLVGQRCRVRIEHQDWQTEIRAVIVSIRPIPPIRRDPAVVDFARRYNHLLQDGQPFGGAAAAPAAQAVPASKPPEQPVAKKESATKHPVPTVTPNAAQSGTQKRETAYYEVLALWGLLSPEQQQETLKWLGVTNLLAAPEVKLRKLLVRLKEIEASRMGAQGKKENVDVS